MISCNKKIFVKYLDKYKPCIRKAGHRTPHTPNLVGERFGINEVVKLGKPYKDVSAGGLKTTWVVKQRGVFKTIMAVRLLAGRSRGTKIQHFTWSPGDKRAEYRTIVNHRIWIFNEKSHSHKNYRGMPFHASWNPDKGGAIWRGAEWIINNLGKKPGPEWSLDVINHKTGFVPGNLRWAKKLTQNRNKQYKTLGTFGLDELIAEAKRHGYKLVRIK